MKKILTALGVLGFFIVVCAISTYFLYTLPKNESERLKFDEMRWTQEQLDKQKETQPQKVNITSNENPKKDTSENEKLILVEYKIDAQQVLNAQTEASNDALHYFSTYCPNLKSPDSMFTIIQSWYASLKQKYSPYQDKIPYINTNLKALANEFKEIETLCGY